MIKISHAEFQLNLCRFIGCMDLSPYANHAVLWIAIAENLYCATAFSENVHQISVKCVKICYVIHGEVLWRSSRVYYWSVWVKIELPDNFYWECLMSNFGVMWLCPDKHVSTQFFWRGGEGQLSSIQSKVRRKWNSLIGSKKYL